MNFRFGTTYACLETSLTCPGKGVKGELWVVGGEKERIKNSEFRIQKRRR